jgi:ABC-2 type transport system permease protein
VRINGFLQLVWAQATMLRRNTGFWLSSIIVAVVSILVFGWLFNPDASAFDLALVDEDGSEASGQLLAVFEAIDNVEVVVGERDEELSALEEGDRSAMVVIPNGFERDLAVGAASVQAYYDNSDLIRVGYVASTVSAVIGVFNDEIAGSSAGVTLEEQAISTETVRYIDFLTPGMVGMAIMYINLGVGFLLVTWREQGILRRLGVTPLRPGDLIASQAVSFAVVSVLQVVIILGLAHFVFDVSLNGSLAWLAVTVALGIGTMLAIGYVIGSFLQTPTAVNAVINAVAFPMIFLGRSYFPLDTPPALAPLVQAIPLTHINAALREVVNGSGELGDLWVSWTVLAVWIVVGFGLSVRVFRWQ